MPTLLTSRLFVDHLRFQVNNYRILRRGAYEMALQLKGLRANVNGLRSDIEEMSRLAAGGREKASVLKSHLGDIQSEIGQHVDDIEFTANVLGNSSNGSEDSQSKPVVSQTAAAATIIADTGKAAQGSPLEVGTASASHFPGQV